MIKIVACGMTDVHRVQTRLIAGTNLETATTDLPGNDPPAKAGADFFAGQETEAMATKEETSLRQSRRDSNRSPSGSCTGRAGLPKMRQTLSLTDLFMPLRLTVALLALATTLALPLPAQAVIILDSTWAENGGAEGDEAAGFGAHVALAEQPQFAAIFGLHNGDTYGGSGTWIGNDAEGYGYILTAAHNFGAKPDPANWTYWSRAGTAYQGVEVHIHPGYDPNDDSTSGYDLAIVVLDAPVTDAGPAPKLYAGSEELGAVLTMVGYGSRGIGSVGEEDAYYDFDGETPAAARNVVDEVDGENGENNLIVDLDSEDGSSNVMGDANPIDPLEGILGSGDSGGSAWIKTASGWAIAATNTWGDDAVYGSISGFSRVSTQLDWIGSIFPDYRIAE